MRESRKTPKKWKVRNSNNKEKGEGVLTLRITNGEKKQKKKRNLNR